MKSEPQIIEYPVTVDGQRLEVEAKYTPPIPPPFAHNPSNDRYADPGDGPVIDILAVRCPCGDEIPMSLIGSTALAGLEAQGLVAGQARVDRAAADAKEAMAEALEATP